MAIDGLELNLVKEFNCSNLMQKHYGKTDLSEFSQPRTIVLWSTFLAGRNTEREVLALGKKMWEFTLKKEETFLHNFKRPFIIDMPGYNYHQDQHALERQLLKDYFTTEEPTKRGEILKRYNDIAFAHHRRVKASFQEAVKKNHDIVVGYFSLADVLGHLNFGNLTMMRLIYKEFDELAAEIWELRPNCALVISDHGMKPMGPYGDHSDYGFWSSNIEDLGRPRLSQFHNIINRWYKENFQWKTY